MIYTGMYSYIEQNFPYKYQGLANAILLDLRIADPDTLEDLAQLRKDFTSVVDAIFDTMEEQQNCYLDFGKGR